MTKRNIINFREKCSSHSGDVSGKKIEQIDANDYVEKKYWQSLKDRYKQGDHSVLEENVAVHFRRCIIESILSDPECDGIRFYFAEVNSKLTLVLTGYNKNGLDLCTKSDLANKNGSIIIDGKYPHSDLGKTYIAEVGGGRKLKDYWCPECPPPPYTINENTSAHDALMKEYFYHFMKQDNLDVEGNI